MSPCNVPISLMLFELQLAWYVYLQMANWDLPVDLPEPKVILNCGKRF